MSNQRVTFLIKKVATVPLTISIAIPSGPTGKFVGHAKVRSKTANKEFFERVESGEYQDKDEEVLRELYDGFDGIGNVDGYCEGEAAFQEILTGDFSAYMYPACIQAFYEQYGEAKQGNSKGRRVR